MSDSVVLFVTVAAFLATVVLVLWRPKGINEAFFAAGGAAVVLAAGSVSWADLGHITVTVSGAAITIIATIVMAIVLESIGFFYWAAEGLAARARGSGIRLFWLVNLLCFLMTLFFNNDGSILITTPILIILLRNLGIKPHQQVPYLLSGALVATASSAPIGVSNVVNLISLKMIGMDLFLNTQLMFVPAMLGLLFMTAVIYLVIGHQLPRTLLRSRHVRIDPFHHPLKRSPEDPPAHNEQRMIRILLFVLLIRLGLFAASYFGIPIEYVAVAGSLILLGWRWQALGVPPYDIIKKTPWHIFAFAFSMYVVIMGLNNIGLTEWMIELLRPYVTASLAHAGFIMGGLLTFMSTLFNNHPALMIGTLTLTGMSLDTNTLYVTYLATVIGSDIGALLLPIGTLASLIWLHLLRQYRIKVGWRQYMRITFVVIPPTLIFTLLCLHIWTSYVLGMK
ncbi:ArsB/NhaD family transporter [Paenibacillus xylaniclasticus]|uniref:ArsB/NhaD family transporter n=1 Tax=Paenibacillus xylaniclasticus TaxID=588083 RepID=UPI000FD91205|nr:MULTISPECIES: ArsB/NhaD family transporter [Paenibacillus]GFN29820.1 putative arsenical pump membrane protein [Paenibacillus curdlanolyticus]